MNKIICILRELAEQTPGFCIAFILTLLLVTINPSALDKLLSVNRLSSENSDSLRLTAFISVVVIISIIINRVYAFTCRQIRKHRIRLYIANLSGEEKNTFDQIAYSPNCVALLPINSGWVHSLKRHGLIEICGNIQQPNYNYNNQLVFSYTLSDLALDAIRKQSSHSN